MAEPGVKCWNLSGRLDFSSVPEVWPRFEARISESKRLQVSLAGVQQANSAALALLLQGVEHARRSGCQLHYINLPDELLALARVSNVATLLAGGKAPIES